MIQSSVEKSAREVHAYSSGSPMAKRPAANRLFSRNTFGMDAISISMNTSSSPGVMSKNDSGYATPVLSILSLPEGSTRVDTSGEQESACCILFLMSDMYYFRSLLSEKE